MGRLDLSQRCIKVVHLARNWMCQQRKGTALNGKWELRHNEAQQVVGRGGGENLRFIKKTDRILGRAAAAARSAAHSFSSQFERQVSSRSEVKQAKMTAIYFSGIRTDKTNAKHICRQCADNIQNLILTHRWNVVNYVCRSGMQDTHFLEKHVFRRWFMFTDWRGKICT